MSRNYKKNSLLLADHINESSVNFLIKNPKLKQLCINFSFEAKCSFQVNLYAIYKGCDLSFQQKGEDIVSAFENCQRKMQKRINKIDSIKISKERKVRGQQAVV